MPPFAPLTGGETFGGGSSRYAAAMLSEDLRSVTRPLGEFRGLSLDVTYPRRQAAFWRIALGGTVATEAGERLGIAPGPGRPRTEILHLRPVAAAAPDGARVHLDLRLAGPEPGPLLRAGARVVRHPGPDPWWVLADTEGNELCAFPAVDDRPAGIFELVVKCHDPHRLSRWWAAVLGGAAEEEGEAAVVAGAVDFPWDYMVFDRVPDGALPPNRLRWHIALRTSDPAELLAMGASLRIPASAGAPALMADPEGNEFFVSGAAVP
jgi:hypothetical protein